MLLAQHGAAVAENFPDADGEVGVDGGFAAKVDLAYAKKRFVIQAEAKIEAGLTLVVKLSIYVEGRALSWTGRKEWELAGFRWGSGTLAYAGKTYPVKVEGLSVGEVGVTRATAKGEVSNLTKLEDFPGNYVAVGAEATAAGGAGMKVMRNQNGVVIEMKSTTQGASLKLGAEGIRLSLAN